MRQGLEGSSNGWYQHCAKSQLSPLRHIEDQVHSIARMVEQDQYCIDILTRVTASSRALHSVAVGADGADEQSRSK